MIASSIEKEYPYHITCPTLLIIGDYDNAPTKRLNQLWAENTVFVLLQIANAGHNSNIDQPKIVNQAIEDFIGG